MAKKRVFVLVAEGPVFYAGGEEFAVLEEKDAKTYDLRRDTMIDMATLKTSGFAFKIFTTYR